MYSVLRAARSLGKSNGALAPRQFTRSMTIPVDSVARVLRMKVAGEPEAESVDALLRPVAESLKQFKGFEKITRHVCKTEWAYEAHAVFDGLDNFQAYMESPEREELLSVLEEIKEYAIDGEIYSGNRVHDDF
eukprot:g6030.t1